MSPVSATAAATPVLPVLVGVDGSAHNASAVAWAAAEASASGQDLLLVYAVGGDIPRSTGAQEGGPGRAVARATLERATRRLAKDFPLLAVHTEVLTGSPEDTLAGVPTLRINRDRQANEGRPADPEGVPASPGPAADMVVLGRRGAGGFARMLLGSTSLTVAGTSTSPVVVVPSALPRAGTSSADSGRIVVGIDPFEPAEAVLGLALDRGARVHATVEVLASWQVPDVAAHAGLGIAQSWQAAQADAAAALERAMWPWRTHPAVREGQASTTVVDGHPAAVLLDRAPTDGLLILGRGGRTEHPGFRMGPVTWTVLHQTDHPVMVVP